MNETLTSSAPSAVSVSLAAAPAVKTSMTNAVEDLAALQTSTAVETGLNSATSFQDAGWHVAVAQTAANRSMVASIAGEQQQIATARPSVISADPAVTEAVTSSTLMANERLWGRRQNALDMVTSDTTGQQAAVIYDDIAKMRENTQPAAIATSTRSTEERVFSGGTTLDEFIALPQKPGPSSVTALNAELAFLTGANDVAANVTSVAYRAIPVADSVAAEILSAIPAARPTVEVAAFAPAAIADATFIQPASNFALAAAPVTQQESQFAALPNAANTTAMAYRMPEEPTVLYDSGKMPRSARLLNALGIAKTDMIGMMKAGLADAKFIDVTDLLAEKSERQTGVTQTGSAQILTLNPSPALQLTSDASRDAEALFAAPRQAPEMQPAAPSRQPRGSVSYGMSSSR